MIRFNAFAAACFALGALLAPAQISLAADVPAHIAAAVADKGRPEADTQRDENRKPAAVAAFAGLAPGAKVVDLNPGGGYFTRIFSKAVGEKGHVYALVPAETLERRPQAADAVKAIAADAAYANTSVISPSLQEAGAGEPLDLVWTSLNYHDFKNRGEGVTAAMNASIFKALKPGGIYMVIDHAAAAGSGGRDTETLHRIDPDLVKQEVLAAGFVLDGESDVLRNPADDHALRVQENDIRGKTDQFVFRFKKP